MNWNGEMASQLSQEQHHVTVVKPGGAANNFFQDVVTLCGI